MDMFKGSEYIFMFSYFENWVATWDAREKFGRGEPPFFNPNPAAAADEPFLFLLLLAGFVASEKTTLHLVQPFYTDLHNVATKYGGLFKKVS